jgi:hypothetical protein
MKIGIVVTVLLTATLIGFLASIGASGVLQGPCDAQYCFIEGAKISVLLLQSLQNPLVGGGAVIFFGGIYRGIGSLIVRRTP